MEKFLTPFCREIISRKSHKSIPVGSKRFGSTSTSAKIGLAGKITPPHPVSMRVNSKLEAKILKLAGRDFEEQKRSLHDAEDCVKIDCPFSIK